jgi:hypothetical protein
MGSNLILRLLWTFTISPDALGFVTPGQSNLLTTILAALEILRRAQWSILLFYLHMLTYIDVFRVENEQLNNVGKYRAINIVVPLTDFHYDDYVAKSRVAN